MAKRWRKKWKPKSTRPVPTTSSTTVDLVKDADWSKGCEVCGNKPIIKPWTMCALCITGESDAYLESLGQ